MSDMGILPERNAYVNHIFSIFMSLIKAFGPQPQQTMAAAGHDKDISDAP